MKRALDMIISISGLLILFPLFLITALVIKLHDKGPVFYKTRRVGQGGKLFYMYKFRTMVIDADKKGPSSSPKSDSRVTSVGRFLRRYKLDEIPQLINVLSGSMSIVGPRPEEKKFTDLFTEEEMIILSLKPGITDWASLWNSNEADLLEGSVDPDAFYLNHIRPEKLRLQLNYARKHNFFIDLQILFLTLKKLILKKQG